MENFLLFALTFFTMLFFVYTIEQYIKYKNNIRELFLEKLYTLQNDLLKEANTKNNHVSKSVIAELLEDSNRCGSIIENKRNPFNVLKKTKLNDEEIQKKYNEKNQYLNSLLKKENNYSKNFYTEYEKKMKSLVVSYFETHSIRGKAFNKIQNNKNEKINQFVEKIDFNIDYSIKNT